MGYLEYNPLIWFMAREPLKLHDFVIIVDFDEVRHRKKGESPVLRVAEDLGKEEYVVGDSIPCEPLYDESKHLLYNIELDGKKYYKGTHIEEIEEVNITPITTYVKEYTGKLK